MKKLSILIAITVIIIALLVVFASNKSNSNSTLNATPGATVAPTSQAGIVDQLQSLFIHPLQISEMRKKQYPGSQFKIVQTLPAGSNYQRYIASYLSDGYTIQGLLTIPNAAPPTGGHPAILFNHGYIAPSEYRTTEKYVAYLDAFARNGYVVFKSDYRGHGSSEGSPEGAYYSPAYTNDVLNALGSIKQMPEVNKAKIGFWGHSMGGHITLRSMVVTNEIKAGVIWAGVVGTYDQMLNEWRRRPNTITEPGSQASRNSEREEMLRRFENPQNLNPFWNSISPIEFVNDISGPVQIHHGTADTVVPIDFSRTLRDRLQQAGKQVEYFEYAGADHNLAGAAFTPAINRSVQFFDTHVKN